MEHVILTFSTAPHHVLLRIARTCEELRVGVHLVPRLFESVTDRLTVDHLGGLPLHLDAPFGPEGVAGRRSSTCSTAMIAAAALLVFCAPVLALAAIRALLTMGRRSSTLNRESAGRPRFTLLKLRSMRPPVDGRRGPGRRGAGHEVRQLPPQDCVG